MTNKAREVLACLVDARGNWVPKSQILARVWPDTHVHPDNIKVLIREIRVALNDDARNPRFVRSSRGRGYAFIGRIGDPVTTTWHGPVRLRTVSYSAGSATDSVQAVIDPFGHSRTTNTSSVASLYNSTHSRVGV
jgi:DNA-binding winged helix-turn-helix (wHTH) protein